MPRDDNVNKERQAAGLLTLSDACADGQHAQCLDYTDEAEDLCACLCHEEEFPA